MMEMIRKHKKALIITLCVVLAASGTIVFINHKRNNENVSQEYEYIRTVTLSKSKLMDTVVATGIIESQNTSSITSNINGSSISKINFSVGDYVNEGDVVIELDTTNLNKQITSQSEKIEKQVDSLQSKYDAAYDSYSDAEDAYNNAKNNLSNASNALANVNGLIESYQSDYNEKTNLVNEAYKNSFEDENITISGDDKTGYIMNPDTYEYAVKLQNQKDALYQLENAKVAYNYNEILNTYNDATNEYNQAKSKYTQSETVFEEANSNLNNGVDTSSLDDLYDTVSNYKLKAKSSGQITSLNAVVGGNINGTLATIQDTNKLKLSLMIDEYDILKLKLGMKANIQTDASDKIYEGELSQISPTASSMNSGFGIEVVVTSEDVSDLLIGMNAEVSIIVSSGSDNFNVPIDAVGKNTNGQNVVYVQNENGEFDEVVVETGLSSGYYIEIFSDELVAGAKVRASANEDDAKVKIVQDEESNDFSQMFGIGGITPGQGSNFNPGFGGNFTPGNGFNGNRQNGNSGFNRGGN